MGFVVEGWEANEGIENNCHQGIKEVPPTKDEDWDQRSSLPRLKG